MASVRHRGCLSQAHGAVWQRSGAPDKLGDVGMLQLLSRQESRLLRRRRRRRHQRTPQSERTDSTAARFRTDEKNTCTPSRAITAGSIRSRPRCLSVKLPHLEAWNEARRRTRPPGYEASVLPRTGFPLPKHRVDRRRARLPPLRDAGTRPARRAFPRAAHAQRGIQTGIHYPIPIHLQPAYRGAETRSGLQGRFAEGDGAQPPAAWCRCRSMPR